MKTLKSPLTVTPITPVVSSPSAIRAVIYFTTQGGEVGWAVRGMDEWRSIQAFNDDMGVATHIFEKLVKQTIPGICTPKGCQQGPMPDIVYMQLPLSE